MAGITIDNTVLGGLVRLARNDYREFLTKLEQDVVTRSNGNFDRLEEAVKQASHTALMFASAYKAMSREVSQRKLFADDRIYGRKFARMYAGFVAAKATENFLDVPAAKQSSQVMSRRAKSVNPELDDYGLVAHVMESMSRRISNPQSTYAMRLDFSAYFREIQQCLLEDMSYKGCSACLDEVKDLHVQIGECSILGVAKPETFSPQSEVRDPNEMFKKPLQEYGFSPVGRDEIVGNDAAMRMLEDAVYGLMLYDAAADSNPVQKVGGFRQNFLLMGTPGVGKTLTARYAMTLAKSLARESGGEVFVTEPDFENAWENGAYLELQNIITTINNDTRPYIIFLDELDLKFPSRTQQSSHGSRQTLGAMLRWLSGGQVNKGNYLVVATSNEPGSLDPALERRFGEGQIVCEGPKDVHDFARCYEIFLGSSELSVDLNAHAVRSMQYGFVGRDVMQVSEKVQEMCRNIRYPRGLPRQSYEQKLAWLQQNRQPVHDEILEREIDAHYEAKQQGSFTFGGAR